MRTEIDPRTGEERTTGEMAEFVKTVLLACLTDPRTEHNLRQNGEKVDLTEEWILNEMDPDDAEWRGTKLALRYLGGQSAEGNATPEPEKPKEKSAPTA